MHGHTMGHTLSWMLRSYFHDRERRKKIPGTPKTTTPGALDNVVYVQVGAEVPPWDAILDPDWASKPRGTTSLSALIKEARG